jgi:hypothetical protein
MPFGTERVRMYPRLSTPGAPPQTPSATTGPTIPPTPSREPVSPARTAPPGPFSSSPTTPLALPTRQTPQALTLAGGPCLYRLPQICKTGFARRGLAYARSGFPQTSPAHPASSWRAYHRRAPRCTRAFFPAAPRCRGRVVHRFPRQALLGSADGQARFSLVWVFPPARPHRRFQHKCTATKRFRPAAERAVYMRRAARPLQASRTDGRLATRRRVDAVAPAMIPTCRANGAAKASSGWRRARWTFGSSALARLCRNTPTD